MTVVPSLALVRFSPSNQAAHRESRCPLMRISYRPASLADDVSLISLLTWIEPGPDLGRLLAVIER